MQVAELEALDAAAHANVARGKACTSSPPWDGNAQFACSAVVDGSSTRGFFSSAGSVAGEFVEVDLGAEADIAFVVVHNRQEHEQRMAGQRVSLLDAQRLAVASFPLLGVRHAQSFALGPPACVSPTATASPSRTPRQPGAPQHLFLVEPNFGRFSNNRMSFAEAMGVAAFSERSLYIPPFRSCGGGAQGPAAIWDLAHMSKTLGAQVHEDALSDADVAALCPEGERMYVWVDGFTKNFLNGAATPSVDQDRTTWRGLEWPVLESRNLPFDASAAPADNASYYRESKTSMAYVEPYASWFSERFVTRDLKGYLLDDWLPQRIAALPHRCVAIHALYLQTNWAVMPGMLPRVAQAFRPSENLERAVASWFASNGAVQDASVGVHLRLGDMQGFPYGLAHHCTRDAGFLLDEIRAAQTRAQESAPLLVASDEFDGPCAVAVMKAFPNHKRVESGGVLSGCAESAFTQEVLGRTAAFIGNSFSSFSIAAQWVRLARGRPAASNAFPEGPNPAPMTSFFDTH